METPLHVVRSSFSSPCVKNELLETNGEMVYITQSINNPMKTSITQTIVLGCLGIAIGTLLPGCVEPYAQGYGITLRGHCLPSRL